MMILVANGKRNENPGRSTLMSPGRLPKGMPIFPASQTKSPTAISPNPSKIIHLPKAEKSIIQSYTLLHPCANVLRRVTKFAIYLTQGPGVGCIQTSHSTRYATRYLYRTCCARPIGKRVQVLIHPTLKAPNPYSESSSLPSPPPLTASSAATSNSFIPRASSSRR